MAENNIGKCLCCICKKIDCVVSKQDDILCYLKDNLKCDCDCKCKCDDNDDDDNNGNGNDKDK